VFIRDFEVPAEDEVNIVEVNDYEFDDFRERTVTDQIVAHALASVQQHSGVITYVYNGWAIGQQFARYIDQRFQVTK